MAEPPLQFMILQTPSRRDPTESPMSTEVCRTYCKGGLKTCIESPMSTEVCRDYCKLRDLKRPPVQARTPTDGSKKHPGGSRLLHRPAGTPRQCQELEQLDYHNPRKAIWRCRIASGELRVRTCYKLDLFKTKKGPEPT